jgi:hypothetical protein
MDDIDLDQERRLLRLEGTVAWMKWVLTTLGAAIAMGAGAWLFSKL